MFIAQLKFARVENGRLVLHDCEYTKPQQACQRGKEKNDKVSRCCWSAYQEKKIRWNEITRNETTPGSDTEHETSCAHNGWILANTEIKCILHIMAITMNYVMPSQRKFYKWRTMHSSHFTAFSDWGEWSIAITTLWSITNCNTNLERL